MIALNRGRKLATCLVATATIGALAAQWASAQQRSGRAPATPPPAKTDQAGNSPRLQEVRVPANTNDPIALVNGEVITRQQLADECVARHGKEILETLIARRLINQEMRAKKIEVTAAEIDREIDNVAFKTAQVTREVWLRNLDKERGISPVQYARDIIYPTLALKKLADARGVQVTEQDLKDSFDANYGPRLRCRLIMCKNIHAATEIWEELRKNPGGFEKLAKDRSTDSSTRASGGMLPDPLARHAYPRTVSDAAFAQLVDGDPKDSNPAHKPKDGDITGPIQVDQDAWIIMKREEVLPGKSGASLKDPHVREVLIEQMRDVKLSEAVAELFNDLMAASSIDNKLTGHVKMAHEERHPDSLKAKDEKITLMNNVGETKPVTPTGGRSPANVRSSPTGASRPPAGVPTDAAGAADNLQNTVKTAPRTTPPPTTPPGNN
jgi:parvulin-like peptidyl-prolyl isomerase